MDAVTGSGTLSEERALSLAELPAAELAGEAARCARAGKGRLITYSPKVFIPLTKLCRDVCHYCVFSRPPRPGKRAYLTIDEVLQIARAGAAAGCREALFTLGDKPELRYRSVRTELAELGCETTVEYLTRAAEAVLEETGLLPHVNAGVLTRAEATALRKVSVSMGLMLETTAVRLSLPGGPHFGSPDKLPARRLETIRIAGELGIPFTTGILVGIGETRADRIAALLAIREAAEPFGHIQELIVQPFRAKGGTKMAAHPEPTADELVWTIAAARLILGPHSNVQAPPNLAGPDFHELLGAGINDWGGISPVTVDHVNPEARWPDLRALELAARRHGLELAPRLALYPEYLAELDRWVDPKLVGPTLRQADALGLAREDDWFPGVGTQVPRYVTTGRSTPAEPIAEILAKDELGEGDLVALLSSRGDDRRAILESADRLRQAQCGDDVTYVVTRNIQYTNVCYFRCGFCAFSKGRLAANLRGPSYLVPHEEIVRRAIESWERGAVEVCLQGGIHPSFTGEYYLSVVRAIKEAVPEIHVHAFSALEIWQGAATLGIDLPEYLTLLRDAGLGSLPGTAAEILDDDVRRIICPDKVSTEQWLEVHDTAHRIGLPSNVTMMFGHVEGPRSWARHLIAAREQQQRSGGFTEFVPLPFVHMEAPIALKGLARRGPTFGETLLVHAVARLALHPWITNIQVSWVKLGPDGLRMALAAGANDAGGTLMNESISRAAGSEHGQELSPERMEELIVAAGRVPRQRTTLYENAPADRREASFGAPPLADVSNPPVSDARLKRPARLVRPWSGDRPALRR
jgi:FO synthase